MARHVRARLNDYLLIKSIDMNRTVSVYLDAMRLVAALLVLIVHFNYIFPVHLPGFWRISDMGGEAVTVFFVLSGFVIAYVAQFRDLTLSSYAISRAARLYSVVVPALLLTVLLDFSGAMIDPLPYEGLLDDAGWRIGASLFFINELWFASIRPLSNIPFWSLGYEVCYYAIFAAAFYPRNWPTKCIAVAIACLISGPKILLLFPIWLMGVAVYHWTRHRKPAESIGWVLVLGATLAYFVLSYLNASTRLFEWTTATLGKEILLFGPSKKFLFSYVIGILVSIQLTGFISIAGRFNGLAAKVAKPVQRAAAYTFAIYLFHYPLLQFATILTDGLFNPYVRAGVVLGTVGLAIWGLGSVTEMRKTGVRQFITACAGAIASSKVARKIM